MLEKSDQNTPYKHYCDRVEGTTIDRRTLLSTDYFNSFNEVVMLLTMVADTPEVIEDIRAWKYRTYEEHFMESGLSFGPLAIEAYAHVPPDVRTDFENLLTRLRQLIDEARTTLTIATSEQELVQLRLQTNDYSRRLQDLLDTGSGIVHGTNMKLNQSEIDKIF